MASVHRAERASPDHAHSSDNARHNPPAYRPNRVLACASDVFLASGMKLRHAMLAALIAIAPPLAAQPPAADADAGQSRDPLAANLGLAPRQHSSGGKEVLLGITRRGDSYLRTLLIHGARSALRLAGDKPDRLLRWARKLQERKGANVAAVALANKMARVIWALLAHDRDYSPTAGIARTA